MPLKEKIRRIEMACNLNEMNYPSSILECVAYTVEVQRVNVQELKCTRTQRTSNSQVNSVHVSGRGGRGQRKMRETKSGRARKLKIVSGSKVVMSGRGERTCVSRRQCSVRGRGPQSFERRTDQSDRSSGDGIRWTVDAVRRVGVARRHLCSARRRPRPPAATATAAATCCARAVAARPPPPPTAIAPRCTHHSEHKTLYFFYSPKCRATAITHGDVCAALMLRF